MRLICVIITLMLPAAASFAQNYTLEKYVIGSGGGEASSTNYSINGTIGQPAVGFSSSANYNLSSGFWAAEGGTGGGCDYIVGDVNGSSSYNGLDITYGVAFFKGGPNPLCPLGSCPVTPCDGFFYCGDVNASCSYNGLDITYGVSYLKGGPGPNPCADCPPGAGIVLSASNKERAHSVIVTTTKPTVENQSRGSEDVSKLKGNSKSIQNK